MVNKVILIGNLGGEPESTQLNGGGTVVKFSLATSEKWTDKQGKKIEDTQWHRLVAWNKLAEIVQQHLHKGDKVYVEGKLKYGDYMDKENVKRYTTDIVVDTLRMLGGKQNASDAAVAVPAVGAAPAPVVVDDPKDDLPF